ncbi:PiggyBac transposable element-derived protein 3 [Blattella germanica]|nr:PiggyBac transposable element-derived protein 3 [Blattella germanica]
MEIEEYLSVDEIIIPFKGRSSLKQYNQNKPHKWGIKVFAITSSSGILHDFEIYVGKGTVSDTNMGISDDIVVRLAEIVPENKNYKLAFDNWSASHQLLLALKEKRIWTCCTVRSNRMAGCVMASDESLKKVGRGTSDVKVDETNNIVCVKWFDNKSVHLMSSYAGVEPADTVRRWSVKDKQYINVTRPVIVREYNQFMGGVDLLDMLVTLYRINLRVKRYYLRIIYHLTDICVVNAWLLYKRHCQQMKEKPMPLVHFRLEIANALLQSGKVVKRKRGRPTNEADDFVQPPRKRAVHPAPVRNVRFDQIGHWSEHISNKQRCKLCVEAKSRIKCSKCDVALCLHGKKNCFVQYHQK